MPPPAGAIASVALWALNCEAFVMLKKRKSPSATAQEHVGMSFLIGRRQNVNTRRRRNTEAGCGDSLEPLFARAGSDVSAMRLHRKSVRFDPTV